jgi:DNA-binding NarL/FixJ family response regulator
MNDVLRSQVLLVDDHPLFLAGLAHLIAAEPDVEVIATANEAGTAVACVRGTCIDIAVIDVLMPTTTGISLASQIADASPRTRILGLSVLEEPTIVASMIRSGAAGYALKSQPPDQIIDAIRTVLCGKRYVPPSISPALLADLVGNDAEQPLHRLTPREREIFDLLIRGHSNDEISAQLFIARRTVETHRQRIMKKLAAHSILDMIRVAARQGVLTD